MAKFQLKIIIIRVLTKKTQETQADVQIPPLSSADCCLFLFFFLCLTPIVRSSSRTIASAVDCCVSGQDQPWFASNLLPTFRTILLCLVSPPLPRTVDCLSPGRTSPSRSSKESIRAGREPTVSLVPLPSTSCAEEQLEPAIASCLFLREGCFAGPTAKLTTSRATEARGGISDGVVWLLWPLSDDLEAIGHGFSGRSVMDGCVVREKIQYFCTYSHKKFGVGAAHFFQQLTT